MKGKPNKPTAAKSVEPRRDESDAHDTLARAAEAQWSWGAAVKHWEDCAAATERKPNISALTQKAYCLIELGRVDLAAEVFASLADCVEGHKGLAEIAILRGTIQQAAALWDECLTRFPNEIAGFIGKAATFFQREMYQEADELLSRGVVICAGSSEVAALWAHCATAAKNWEVASARWKKVLEKWPRERDVRRGYIRYLAASGDRDAANLYLAGLADERVAMTDCAVEYYIATEDFPGAAREAAKLVELEPHRLQHQLRLATLLMRDGVAWNLHAAFSILKSLYRISPDSVSVLEQFAEACIRSGFNTHAKNLIQAIPPVEQRIGVQILRAWLQRHENSEHAAKKTWNTILDRQYLPAVHAPIAEFDRIDGNEAVRIGREDVLLFSVIRNEYPRLQWFLTYYRKLGVDKFIIVDNASSDESVAFLLKQTDVILYRTSDRYSAAAAGMRWINELIDRYGRENWCLHVDADEAFVYPGQEGLDIRKLIDYLSWRGYESMLAVMLDMYPAVVNRASHAAFETVQSSYTYFDNSFFVHGSPICPYREIFGGVRRRLFQGYQLGNKVPLINARAGIKFLMSSHRTTPAKVADLIAGLKHYHLIYALQPEYRRLFNEAIERREFPSNSLERLRCAELLDEGAADRLLAKESVRFESSEQLLTLATNPMNGLPQPDDYFLKFMRQAMEKAG